MKGRLISRKPEEIQSFTDRETMQNVASDQGVYCLSFSPTVLKSTTNSKMDLFKILDKGGKEFWCPNILS